MSIDIFDIAGMLSFVCGSLLLARNVNLKNQLKILKGTSEAEIAKARLQEAAIHGERNVNLEKHISSLEEKNRSLSEALSLANETKAKEMEALRNGYESTMSNMRGEYERRKAEIHDEHMHRLKDQEANFKATLDSTLDSTMRLINEQMLKSEAISRENIQKMLDESGRSLKISNHESLKPLWEDIDRFTKEIIKNDRENRERQIVLAKEIEMLREQSSKISEDANNLANALRHDKKKQGIWGEMILESIITQSGLVRGREYEAQYSMDDGKGGKLIVDYLINLPRNRCVVVDSKVSIVNYESMVRETDEDAKKRYGNEFLKNIKQHVESLSKKKYHHHAGSGSLECTLMFVPVEGAYQEILVDMDFVTNSFEKGVFIVSPNTFMMVLRIIRTMWVNEEKDKNIVKILDSCKKLVGKFESYTKSLDAIGKALEDASEKYRDAMKYLDTGRGSVRTHVEKIDSYMNKIPDHKAPALDTDDTDTAESQQPAADMPVEMMLEDASAEPQEA